MRGLPCALVAKNARSILSSLPCSLDVGPTNELCHPETLSCEVVTINSKACGQGESKAS